MPKITVTLKPEYKDKVIAYNNSAATLGQRNDLDKLLILSYEAGRTDYLDMFTNPPSLAELKAASVGDILQSIDKQTAKQQQ